MREGKGCRDEKGEDETSGGVTSSVYVLINALSGLDTTHSSKDKLYAIQFTVPSLVYDFTNESRKVERVTSFYSICNV